MSVSVSVMMCTSWGVWCVQSLKRDLCDVANPVELLCCVVFAHVVVVVVDEEVVVMVEG